MAYDKKTGKKLALKVQHPGLRETSVGDIVGKLEFTNVLNILLTKLLRSTNMRSKRSGKPI